MISRKFQLKRSSQHTLKQEFYTTLYIGIILYKKETTMPHVLLFSWVYAMCNIYIGVPHYNLQNLQPRKWVVKDREDGWGMLYYSKINIGILRNCDDDDDDANRTNGYFKWLWWCFVEVHFVLWRPEVRKDTLYPTYYLEEGFWSSRWLWHWCKSLSPSLSGQVTRI